LARFLVRDEVVKRHRLQRVERVDDGGGQLALLDRFSFQRAEPPRRVVPVVALPDLQVAVTVALVVGHGDTVPEINTAPLGREGKQPFDRRAFDVAACLVVVADVQHLGLRAGASFAR